eukprot:superscaffoldBa00001609_g11293
MTEEDVHDLNRRLTAIDCQLRKSELNRKHLEISNKKLLGFAQFPEALQTNANANASSGKQPLTVFIGTNVHKVLTTPSLFAGEVRSNRSSPATESPDTPSPLPDPASQLAAEAKELVQGVCSLTDDK